MDIENNSVTIYSSASHLASIYQRNVDLIFHSLENISAATKELQDAFGQNAYAFGFEVRPSRLEESDVIELERSFKRDAWKVLIEKLGIARYMDSKTKTELDECLIGGRGYNSNNEIDKFPDITEESIYEVLNGYVSAADEFIEKAIVEEFEFWRPQRSALKTNKEKWRVSEKVIRSGVVRRRYGPNWDLCYTHVTSLDNIFHLLDGKGFGGGYAGPLADTIKSTPKSETSCETEYFDCKMYKNSNLHLRFKRLDLLKKFNEIGSKERDGLPNPV